MAQSVTATLIDDIDQSTASETVRFGVDGTAYEINLSAQHASELRSVVSRYISVARRTRAAPSPSPQQQQPRKRAKPDRQQSPRIRPRAAEGELPASPRAPIPRHGADAREAAMRVASVPFGPPGTAEREPASNGRTTRARSSRSLTPRAAQDDLATTESRATVKADVRDDDHGLTDREMQELRTIADAAEPGRNIVAGRLRARGLADRDTAGNWWLTDAGRRELMSA